MSIIVQIIWIYFGHAEGQFQLIIFNQSTTFNSEYANATVSVDQSGYNVELDIFKEINKQFLDVEFRAKAQTDKSTEGLRTLIKRSVDICKLFEEPTSDPIANIVYSHLLDKKNKIAKHCPIKPVYINDLQKINNKINKCFYLG